MKNKKLIFVFIVVIYTCLAFTAINIGEVKADTVASERLFRLYNPSTGEHFYTKSKDEKNQLVPLGWRDEGTAWYAPVSGNPVYRLYNPFSSDHHYTMSSKERDELVKIGWRYEGIGWYSANKDEEFAVPLYRLFNPNEQIGTHHYTTSIQEKESLLPLGWRDEDIAWYAVSLPAPMIIDLSEYQNPQSIDYDKLANQIDGAIVRVYNGSRADNSFQKHIQELKKRGIPVAVYTYVTASDSVEEMKKQANSFYQLASPYQPTFYWLDAEEGILGGLNDGTSARIALEAMRSQLENDGASKIGVYISNHLYNELNIDTAKFGAMWIPTYGLANGYFNEYYLPTATNRYALHQYTGNGRLNGYSGDLDLNRLSGQVEFNYLFG